MKSTLFTYIMSKSTNKLTFLLENCWRSIIPKKVCKLLGYAAIYGEHNLKIPAHGKGDSYFTS